ncbi:MAG: recombination protein RecR [Gammaproteobacteria bacterium]|jgi:recombination protein RecR
MPVSPLIEHLVESLRCLPGVGPKSARRMAYHLLERDRPKALALAQALNDVVQQVGHCTRCRTFTEGELCVLCEAQQRDGAQLCVVESPTDLEAIESGTNYQGLYFVLMGVLSPLDGIGPADLGLDMFERRLDEGGIDEVIIATGTTVEAQATAHYLSELVRERGVRITRLAHGIPLGGGLEYVDSSTLAHAFQRRMTLE